MEFSRQESWSGLPCPPPGDLPNPGTEPSSLASPALAGRFFATVPTGFTITYESAHSEGQDQNQDAEVTWNQRKNSEERESGPPNRSCPHKVKPPAGRWNWCSRLRVRLPSTIPGSWRRITLIHVLFSSLLQSANSVFFSYFYPQTSTSSHPLILRLSLLYNLSIYSSIEYF